jgi:hypothetical protein
MRAFLVVLTILVLASWLIAEPGRPGRVAEGFFDLLAAIMVVVVLVPLAGLAVFGWLAVRYGIRHAPGALRWLAARARRAARLAKRKAKAKAKASTTVKVTS